MLTTITLKKRTEPHGRVFGTIAFTPGTGDSFDIDLELAPWEWLILLYSWTRPNDVMVVSKNLLLELPEEINPELVYKTTDGQYIC